MSKEYVIAVLPGDGIGPEVMAEAKKVLARTGELFGFSLKMTEALTGGAAIDATGTPLPPETLALCKASQAVLFGSVGGAKWDNLPPEKRPEIGGLLALRKALDLYANLRPVRSWPGLEGFCPLAAATVSQGFDILTIRELSSDVYFGKPKERDANHGMDTMVYYRDEVVRIARIGFESARNRKKKVISVDKANVLYTSMFWRDIVKEVAAEYPDVELEHMYVDNAAMQLVLKPGRFDVILTANLFGDILSDEAAAIAGSLGMLPSASIGSTVHLYEPAGGSAPDIAGKGIANPIAQILSSAMMLEYSFENLPASAAIWNAVAKVLGDGLRTGDIAGKDGKPVSTSAMGDAICAALRK